jgi:hypothetical protein
MRISKSGGRGRPFAQPGVRAVVVAVVARPGAAPRGRARRLWQVYDQSLKQARATST